MDTLQDRLKNFEELVMHDAENQKHELILRLERKKHEQIDRSELRLLESARDYIRSKIISIEKLKNETLVKNRLDHKQKLVGIRTQLIDQLFAKVEEQIHTFVMYEVGYTNWFLECLEKIIRDLKITKAQVIIREGEYSQLVSALESKHFNINYTDKNILGGFKIRDEDQNLSVDNTLKTRVNTVYNEFLINHPELSIE